MQWNARRWLPVVLAVGVLTRLGLWLIYPLTSNNDSATYVHLAKNLVNHGFKTYNATRTPGYPAFLALSGDFPYAAQLLLGLLTTLLFFYIGRKLTGRPWFGALAALAHSLDLGQLFFEGTLLTETLTTFLVTLSLAAALFAWRQPGTRGRVAAAFAAGLAAALAAMARPLFVFLPFLLALFLFAWGARPPQRWLPALAAALPAVLIFGLWVSFVYVNYSILSFDTIGGYRWLNHTGSYFEYVPDKYAALRDTYIQYRDRKIAETGTQTNAAWDALDEMQKVSGLGYFGLSRLLTELSIGLILAHPDLYLKDVLSGWWTFWWAAVYWTAGALKLPPLVPAISLLILIERGFLVLANGIFVAGSVLALLVKKVRAWLAMDPFIWLGVAALWSASVLQTLLDHGDNPRYLVPLQTLAVLIVLYWVFQAIISAYAARHPRGSSSSCEVPRSGERRAERSAKSRTAGSGAAVCWRRSRRTLSSHWIFP
jgi:4-amino-4-deoxy-L-arabinose transferase-like glycosyltransferase